MNADTPRPLVGRTTLTPADGAELVKASQARFGYFNQPRVLSYSAQFGIMAAIVALSPYRLAGWPMLAIAIVLFVFAAWIPKRVVRVIAASYGREREIALDDEGVTVSDPGMSTSWTWSRVERAIEHRDHITLFASMGVIVVLRRAFDADSFARVRALIAAKVTAPEPR